MVSLARTVGSVSEDNRISSNELMKESLGVLVHDLATPLSILAFLVSSLSREDSPPPSIQRAVKALEMTQQILSTTKSIYLNNGDLPDNTGVDLIKLIHEAVAYVQYLAYDKLIRIEVASHLEESQAVVAGQYEIIKNQILVNILTNAIKFSHAESRIVVKLTASSNKFYLEVIDHGVGIPAKFLAELNANAKGKTTRGTSGETGVGLGLHIIKTFSTLLNISFSLRSCTEADNSSSGTTACLAFERL